MSDFKITPGQWHVARDASRIEHTAAVFTENGHVVCECWNGKEDNSVAEEAISNAHAIAALPDLLKAAVRVGLLWGDIEFLPLDEFNAAIDDLRQATIKAKGPAK